MRTLPGVCENLTGSPMSYELDGVVERIELAGYLRRDPDGLELDVAEPARERVHARVVLEQHREVAVHDGGLLVPQGDHDWMVERAQAMFDARPELFSAELSGCSTRP